jgi:hypothetical protein
MNNRQMKGIVVLILCMATSDVFGQDQPISCYLNSEEIDLESIYIKPSSIDNINVDKKAERQTVYITTKEPLIWLTLDAILKNNAGITDSIGEVVYFVNDKLITDKSKIKVDASYFIQVEINRFDKLTYIGEEHKSMIMVDIQLLNDQPKPTIRIRGYEGVIQETGSTRKMTSN